MQRNLSVTDYLMLLKPEKREAELKRLCAQGITPEPTKPRKYLNVPTAYTSIQGFERKYDSIKEAQRAEALDGLVRTKLVRWWQPEPRIRLPGGVDYYPDFIVCWEPEGNVTFEDVKAKDRETQTSKNKRKQALAIYKIDVKIVDGSVK